jgi:hypothetical protein
MNDPISGSDTMNRTRVKSILLFEEEIANLQILPRLCRRAFISQRKRHAAILRFEPSQSIRDNTRSVSVTGSSLESKD